MTDAPTRDQYNDAKAWREYAARLRTALGESNKEMVPLKERALAAERDLARTVKEHRGLTEHFDRLHAIHIRNKATISGIERDFNAGDYPAVADRLTRRREAMERKAEKKAERRAKK